MAPIAVHLQSASVRRAADWTALPSPIKLQIDFHPTGIRRTEAEVLLWIDFTLCAGDHSEPKAGEVLYVEAVLEAGYTSVTGEQPSSEAITSFHKANAVMHCWPYFREFVQSTVAGMHLPVPPVPFLMLNTVTETAPATTRKTPPAKKRPRARH